MYRFILIFIISFIYIYCSEIQAQDEFDYFRNRSEKLADSNTIALRIHNTNFFKNNEYFNSFVEGYTLVGYLIQPVLVYKPHQKLQLELGAHLLKYSGKENFTETFPIFRARYFATNNFSVTLGRIDGNLNHRLAEPILSSEAFFLNNIENGLQLLLNRRIYRMDTWLNWEKFILWGDPYQEEFTVGHNSELTVFKKPNFNLMLTVQGIVTHKGGQIDSAAGDVQSLQNGAIALVFDRYFDGRTLESISFSSNYINFADISAVKKLPYIWGYGIYNKLNINTKRFGIMAAHWYGNMFLNSRGEPMYMNMSDYIPDFRENKRALVINEFYYKQKFLKVFAVKAALNTWFDLYNKTLDYSYSFYIIFNQQINFKHKPINF